MKYLSTFTVLLLLLEPVEARPSRGLQAVTYNMKQRRVASKTNEPTEDEKDTTTPNPPNGDTAPNKGEDAPAVESDPTDTETVEESSEKKKGEKGDKEEDSAAKTNEEEEGGPADDNGYCDAAKNDEPFTTDNHGQVQYTIETIADSIEEALDVGVYVNEIVAGDLVKELILPSCGRRRRRLEDPEFVVQGVAVGESFLHTATCDQLLGDNGEECYQLRSIIDFYINEDGDATKAAIDVQSSIESSFGKLFQADKIGLIETTQIVADTGTENDLEASSAETEGSSPSGPSRGAVIAVVLVVLAVLGAVGAALFVMSKRRRSFQEFKPVEHLSRTLEMSTSGDASQIAPIYLQDEEQSENSSFAKYRGDLSDLKLESIDVVDSSSIVGESLEVDNNGAVFSNTEYSVKVVGKTTDSVLVYSCADTVRL